MTPALSAVAERVNCLDGPDCGAGREDDRQTARPYLLAALVLGCAEPKTGGAVEVAAALELIDRAVLRHYYAVDPTIDERLLEGDRRYALGMREVALRGVPELVSCLATATADVARGQSKAIPEDVPTVLALRSSLWPAAVRMGAALASRRPEAVEVDTATAMGVAREARMAAYDGAARQLREAADCVDSALRDNVFGEEGKYIAAAVRRWLETGGPSSEGR